MHRLGVKAETLEKYGAVSEETAKEILLSLGLAPEIAQGSLRISLDISNTEEEIDYMLEVIPQVVEQLRGMSDDWRKKHCED